MKEYKVIKAFASAQKGDVLSFDNEQDLYIMDVRTDGNCRYMAMDEECADSFVEKGYLMSFTDNTDDIDCDCCEKLGRVNEFVEAAEEQYEKDYENMIESYNNQEIPTCVKVEAETVYFNMCKILNKIKSIINE